MLKNKLPYRHEVECYSNADHPLQYNLQIETQSPSEAPCCPAGGRYEEDQDEALNLVSIFD
jgi:hypothetical protein